jgi:hypothetical protein
MSDPGRQAWSRRKRDDVEFLRQVVRQLLAFDKLLNGATGIVAKTIVPERLSDGSQWRIMFT